MPNDSIAAGERPSLLRAGGRAAPRRINQLPGPRGLPLLGHVAQIDPTRTFQILCEWADRYGPMYVFRIARQPIVVINDVELAGPLLQDRPERYRRWRKMEELGLEIGVDGVFIAEGANWRRHRKMVMQALNNGNVRQFMARLEQVTARLQQRWERAARAGQPVDAQRDLMRYTVDVVTGLAFGDDLNTLEEVEAPIQQHLDKVFPAVARRQTALFPYWRYIKLPVDREVNAALREVQKIINRMITKVRARLALDPALQTRPSNLLEALVAAQDEEAGAFTDAEISGNVLTLLLAGEDTTANTIAWMMHFMTKFPEVQRRMQEEADDVLREAPRPRDSADVDRLRYIESVAHESLRHKPVAPMLLLEPNQDVEIGGVHIPRGTPLFVLTGHLARQPEHFTEASEFRPERWLCPHATGEPGHNTKAFLPFGAGPRYCPGRHLAMLEIQMAIGMLCKNFEVTRTPGTPPTEERYAFTMFPTNLMVNLKRRPR